MLKIEGLWKQAGSFRLGDIDLLVKKGEYFVLLGPSGAGKTLLLEILAGFQQAARGRIFLDGRQVEGLSIQERRIGYLCQGDTLFPHLTVRENIAYGLRLRRLPSAILEEKIKTTAAETGTLNLLERRIEGLSGGERQRVALARMLVLQPACLLLDEPLTGLDELLRQDILGLLHELHASGRTFIHVTHDPGEAMAVASRTAIMEDGRIIQEGSPKEILLRPESEFAARFAGIRNFYPVEVQSMGPNSQADRVTVWIQGRFGKVRLSAPCRLVPGTGSMFLVLDERQVLLKEHGTEGIDVSNRFQGMVEGFSPAYRSAGAAITLDVGFRVCAAVSSINRFEKGDRVHVCWPDEAMRFYRGNIQG